MATADLIRDARLAQGLTQQELGERLGYADRVAKRMVQSIEYGQRPVPRSRIKAVAAVLGLTLDELVE